MPNLSSSEFEKIVDSWIDEHKDYRNQKSTSIGFGYRALNAVCESDPQTGLALIEEISRRNSSDQIMEVLAAGPLENLLATHGKEIIDKVVSLAAREVVFRELLGGVWIESLHPEVRKRIEAVRSGEW